MSRRVRLITVCAECLCASCWHGEFMCEGSGDAGTVEKTAAELRKLNREHPHHFSRQNVERVCGGSIFREAIP